MASLQKTFTGDLSTAIASRLLSAYFKYEDDNYIAQGKPASNVSGTDPMMPGGGGGGNSPINPEIVDRTPFDGLVKKPSIVNTASSKGIVVRDQKLGNFVAAVAVSISSSLNSINEKLDESSDGISAAKDGIDQTYKKLEQSGDSLETKLDAIIEALRYSNKTEKIKRDKRESDAKIAEQEEAVDLSNANRVLMQDMDRQEIRDMQAEDLAEDDRGVIQSGMTEVPEDDLPQLADGGIVSGPDSGYLAVLHGDEAVIPLDNNFTQGQPSAVGETPVSQMPMMAERGITPGDNPSSMKPSFTPNLNISTPILNGGMEIGSGDKLAEAIQLPAKAAGLVTMGIMGKVLQNTDLPPSIISNIKAISSPIAEAFGVPNVMANNLASDIESGQAISQQRTDFANSSKKKKEKGLFQNFKEQIATLIEVVRGGGEGGSMILNRNSSNVVRSVHGGYGVGGWPFGGKKDGKTIIDKMKYDPNHPDGTDQLNPHPPGSTLYNIFERHRQYDQLDMLGSINSGGDSEFFVKNVTYDNAYDYKKFESPEYGLKTSEIAYNMSMEDELNSIREGLADPNSQIIMNTQTAQQDSDNQIEYSAIQVRGNPLKQGTYVSPYSV